MRMVTKSSALPDTLTAAMPAAMTAAMIATMIAARGTEMHRPTGLRIPA